MVKGKKKTVRLLALLLAAGLLLNPAGGSEVQAAKKPKLNKKKLTLRVGKTATLKVKNRAKKAKVSWKSAKKKIATVSKKGKVRAKKAGKTKIICTVKRGGKKKKLICKVTVTGKKPKQTRFPVSDCPGPFFVSPSPEPNSTVVPAPTDTPKPEITYHPDWPSEYKDDYIPLKEMSRGFKVGSAIAGSREDLAAIYDADMVGILQKHYNSTTLTNLMKPTFLLDQEGSRNAADGMPVVNFDSCKKELQFCQDTGISLRGHVLVWYNQTPSWFFYEDYDITKGLADKETMSARMESYIRQVVTYVQENYPGVVYCWDVVNEAVEEDGSIRKNNNLWYETYAGDNPDYAEYEYVKDAFTYAKKYVEPGVALVYNDYNTFKPEKRKGILDMISWVNQQEMLIDTVGMQCPILPEWPQIHGSEEVDSAVDACVEYAIDDFAKAGLEIMITELCVRTEGGNTKAEMENQAARYKEMYQLFMEKDKESGGSAQITSVTTFGISDSYRLYPDSSWKPGDESRYAWLFDKNCKAKLAFKCVYNVFAKAAGKAEVLETIGDSEGGGSQTEEKTHRITGTVMGKNGVHYANQQGFIYRVSGENEGSYVRTIETDQEGMYSLTLPDGEYYYQIGKYEGALTVTAQDPEDWALNIVFDDNLYYFRATFYSSNKKRWSQRTVCYQRQFESGGEGDLMENSLNTDEQGKVEMYLPQGSYKFWAVGSEQDEGYSLTLDESGETELTLDIVLDKGIYTLSGTCSIDPARYYEGAGMEDCALYVESKDEILHLNVEDDGSFSGQLSEGNYALVLYIYTEYNEYGEREYLKIYYMNLEVRDDRQIQMSNDRIHTLLPDLGTDFPASATTELYYNLDSTVWGKGIDRIYLGEIEADLNISGKTYGEDGTVTAFVGMNEHIAVTETSPAEIPLSLTPETQEMVPFEPGDTQICTKQDFEKNVDCYFGKSVIFRVKPEETGDYDFSVSLEGAKTEEEKWLYVYADWLSGDGKYIWEEEEGCRYEYYAVSGEQTNGKVHLEAGKTYFVVVIGEEVSRFESKTTLLLTKH